MVGVYAAWMPGKGASILTALTPALLLVAAVLGLTAWFHQQFDKHSAWSHTLHRISYGLFFVSEPIILHSMWFLQPLAVAVWLKVVITALVLAIYGYLLCRYALFHIPCFKSKG
jgi:peptidoglycan/LPS O-acetylase OafA/YrhL